MYWTNKLGAFKEIFYFQNTALIKTGKKKKSQKACVFGNVYFRLKLPHYVAM